MPLFYDPAATVDLPPGDVLDTQHLRRQTSWLDDLFHRACADIVDSHRDAELSPVDIARRLRCSRATLYRAFQAKRLTINGCILNVRLQQIRIELDTSDPRTPISTLALDHGFASLSHFHRLFKQAYGRTPGEVRNEALWRRRTSID